MSERLFSPKPQKVKTIAWMGGVILVGLIILYASLPRPERPASRLHIDLDTAKTMAGWLALPERSPLSEAELEKARLGKSLFYDRALSATGDRSCADCHAPAAPRTHKTELASPILVDLDLAHWFFHDGRQDSLTGAVLESLEHPDAMGSNRAHIVRSIKLRYLADYMAVFGELPVDLPDPLPPAAYPFPATRLELPIDIASAALETIGNTEQLTDILATARQTYRVPATELSDRALIVHSPEKAWVTAFRALSPKEKDALNTVFVNAGRAIAAYVATRRSLPSPFDAFAKRLQSSDTLPAALNDEFDQTAGQGFAFFVGEGGCVRCHNGPLLSDQQFHNIGLRSQSDRLLLGRSTGIVRLLASPYNCRAPLLAQNANQTTSCLEIPYLDIDGPDLLGAFKTPHLRQLHQSGPYMHDNRYESLSDVLSHYDTLTDKAAVGRVSPLLRPLHLTEEEQAAVTAFLASLTSPITELDNQPLRNQQSNQ